MKSIYLGPLSDLSIGAARAYKPAPDLSVFAVRNADEVHIYRNRCPHTGVELNWMPDKFLDREGEHIHCASHGALFDIDTGRCIIGPCGGAYLEKLSSRVDGDNIYLNLENPP